MSAPPDTPHVAYVTDGGYAALTMISLVSLLRQRNGPVRVTIFTSGVLPQVVAWLARLGAEFSQAQLEAVALEALPRPEGIPQQYTTATFQRLALRPHCAGRMIYLDGDMLVCDDIGKLHGADLGGRALGAVLDYALRRVWTMQTARLPFGRKPPGWFIDFRRRLDPFVDFGRYVNTGMLMFDFGHPEHGPVFDRLCDVQAAIRFCVENGAPYADQDWINHVGQDDTALLDPRWNLFWTTETAKLRALKRAEARVWARAMAAPGLVHLTGGGPRPWEVDRPEEPFRAWVWERFQQTVEDAGELLGDAVKEKYSRRVTASS